MFEDAAWSDEEESSNKTITKKKKKKEKNSSFESLNGGSKLKTLTSAVKRKFEKCVSSPSLTKNLIENDSEADETPQKKKPKTDFDETGPGSLLRKGIKFSSNDEYVKFMQPVGDKKKEKRKEKKKQNRIEQRAEKHCPVLQSFSQKNGSPETSTTDNAKSSKSENAKFNVAKIKELFSSASKNDELKEKKEPVVDEKPAKNEAKSKLQSAHFRHLNEQLYTQTGNQSLKMFQKDPDAFKVYHEGFQTQAKKWPSDPLDKIIASLMKMSGSFIVADFGCGEARLARSFQGSDEVKVHSFDLVKLNDYVTVCDFAKIPLEDESCNVAVFCLSLMGTNLKDFLKEANRVLKVGGTLKIAEVVSRFKDLNFEDFLHLIVKYGFQVKWKDTSNEFFYLADLKKVNECKKKPPEFKLKPCKYKKR